MELESRFVGTRSKPLEITVSPRQAMNFAAALYDNNPCYIDDSREGGIVAPPMLAVALTWPLSSKFDTYWQVPEFPEEARQRQVHYNESIIWKRPIRPDETLTIRGEIVAMTPHPAGALITMRYDAAGAARDLVFVEHISGLLRDVVLTDSGAVRDTLPAPVAFPEGNPGGWSVDVDIDPLAAHVYDGCTNIVFPIHTSVAFARLVGLPNPIYHGTATLGLAVREILNREANGDPTRLSAVYCGFRAMVLPGTRIKVAVQSVIETTRERIVAFAVKNSVGATALKHGRVHIRNRD